MMKIKHFLSTYQDSAPTLFCIIILLSHRKLILYGYICYNGSVNTPNLCLISDGIDVCDAVWSMACYD